MPLTEDEIKKLALELNSLLEDHTKCKFGSICVEDLEEAVKFYKNFNAAMESGKKTFFTTIIALISTGTVGLLILGFYYKIKEISGH